MIETMESKFRKLAIKIREQEQQLETPMKVEVIKPKENEGASGDRKIVKEGQSVYQYIKVDNNWYKTELEKA
tara:strand:- start:1310 stop:1525 length:216 start_codon:yes stop_codon:yes gene_type:complete